VRARDVHGLGMVVMVLSAAFILFWSVGVVPRETGQAEARSIMKLTATRTTWSGSPTRARFSRTLLNSAIVLKLFDESRALRVAPVGYVNNGILFQPGHGWGPRLTVVFMRGSRILLTVVDTGLSIAHNPLVLVNGHAVIQRDNAYLHDLYAALQVNRARVLHVSQIP
jgi:hypothetical protein